MASSQTQERAPLLLRKPLSAGDGGTFNIKKELVLLARRTAPICASFALQNIVQATSVVIAGTIDPFALAITSYGFMFFSCTGTMVAIGGATALDTLCAQALDSDAALEDGQVLGLLLRQCLLVLLTLFGTLVTPVWVISGRLFEALGQERGFARETGKFMLMMLPAGMLQVLSECLKKFLQVQNGSDAVGYMTFVASVVGILSNIALVWWTSLGVWAGPVAFGLYQGVAVMLLLCWICIDSTIPKKGLIATAGVTTGLAQSLFYAITGVCTIATEWWSFEILAIMAARLQKDSIGAQGILMSSDLLLTTVSLGISVAASHRIGNLLGADQGLQAKRTTAIPYLLSLIVGALEFAIIMLVRNHYGRIFTTDGAVIRKVADVLPLMAVFQVLDLANGGAGGILRGAGRNHLSGACNFIAYYGIGLTTAWFLCFHQRLGLFGLWAGIISGSAVLLILQTFCIWCIRWDELGNKISRRYAD